MAYVYQGKKPLPEAERVKVKDNQHRLRPCGTTAAIKRHYRAGEPLCRDCKDWMRIDGQMKREKERIRMQLEAEVGLRRIKGSTKPPPKKRRIGQEGKNAHGRVYFLGDFIPPLQPCGTTAAAERHRTAGEELCGPCKEGSRLTKRRRARRADPLIGTRIGGAQPLPRKYFIKESRAS